MGRANPLIDLEEKNEGGEEGLRDRLSERFNRNEESEFEIEVKTVENIEGLELKEGDEISIRIQTDEGEEIKLDKITLEEESEEEESEEEESEEEESEEEESEEEESNEKNEEEI